MVKKGLNPKMVSKKIKKDPQWGKVGKYLAQVKKDIAELEKNGNLNGKGEGQLAIIRAIEQILGYIF